LIKKEKYLLCFLFVLSLFLIFSISCRKKEAETDKDIIKVGAILPLTGNAAEFGVSEKNGALMFIEISAPKYYEISFEDSQNNNSSAMNIIAKLELTGYDYYFVSMSGICMSLKPNFKDYKNFMISIAAAKDLTQTGYGIIKMLPDTQNQAKEIVNLIKNVNADNVDNSLIYINDDFGLSFYDVISKELSNIKSFAFSKDEKDFKNIVLKALYERPKLIITIGYGTKLGLLIKTIREMGFKDEIIATSEVMFNDVKEVAGESLNNLLTVTFDLNRDTEEYKRFSESYKKKFRKVPDYDALLGYDCMRILIEGLESLRTNEKAIIPKNLFNYITNKKYFKTFLGNIAIQKDGRAFYDLAIKKNINGIWEDYEKVDHE